MKKYIAILMAIACAAALLLTGCGQNNDPQPDPQPSGLTGSVATDGSTSMQKVINTLGEAFMNENKGITFTYNPTGSGSGIKAVQEGRCDIGLSSRALKAEEKEAGLKETVLAYDGIAIIVNPENPVSDLTLEQIKQGIETLQSVSGRFHIIETGRYTVVDDCYNANPVSMKASLDVLKEAKGRKVAVLGDMGELGTDEAALHAEVGTHAGTCGIDALYCAGPLCEYLAKAAKEADPKLEIRHFADRESLMAELPQLLQDGDQILVKASHFMEYGKIVEMLSAEK